MQTSKFYTNYAVWGNKILLRYEENGRRFKTAIEDFKPKVYFPKEGGPFKSIHGQELEEAQYGSIKEAKERVREFSDIDGFQPFGYDDFGTQYIAENFRHNDWDFSKIRIAYIDIETECEDGFPDPTRADERLNMITVKVSNSKKFYVFHFGPPVSEEFLSAPLEDEPADKRRPCKVTNAADEAEMLRRFLDFWEAADVDICTGWNQEAFDIPYFVNRVERVLGADQVARLSPWRFVQSREVKAKYGDFVTYTPLGISMIDYMHFYKKFVKAPRDNYRLDTIAKAELGVGKLKHPSGVPGHFLYRNRDTYAWGLKYNLIDVSRLEEIEEATGLLYLALTIAYTTLINYSQVMSPMKTWDSFMFAELKDQGRFFPMIADRNDRGRYDGAYVKEPIPGKYRWVVSVDLTAHYPAIIMAMNVSPETMNPDLRLDMNVESVINGRVDTARLVENNVSATSNGVTYTKEFLGFLPELLKKLFNERQRYKKEMLGYQTEVSKLEAAGDDADKDSLFANKRLSTRARVQQLTMKELLSSLYGCLGSPWFRFYDLRMAEGITWTGQAIIQGVNEDINDLLNEFVGTEGVDYCITMDTDSGYFNMESVVEKLFPNGYDTKGEVVERLDEFCKGPLQELIEKSLDKYATIMNAYEPEVFHMDREAIADVGLFLAKKRYILNVLNMEGVSYVEQGGERKIMGVQAIQSSTPGVVRDKLKEAYDIMLLKDEADLQKFVREFKAEFMTLSPDDIAKNISVSDVTKYIVPDHITPPWPKAAPWGSRMALVHNRYLKNAGLGAQYHMIKDGDKVKFVHMKKPNNIGGHDKFAWIDEWPVEMELEEFVDYPTQFEKSFAKPVRAITNLIGWSIKARGTLADFL